MRAFYVDVLQEVRGKAALRRHRRALIDFDESKLISVGRPQLDLDYEDELPASQLRTIMYAPTWQGENDNNNYTSIDCYGPQIVEAALATEGTRLIYKPHPRIAGARQPDMKAGHQRILELIEAANAEGGDKDARAQARALYFGDYGVGESRVAFIETVQKLIAEREEKLKHFDVQPTAAETADEPES